MYRYMYQDFSMLCIAAGVFFVLGLIYFFSTPSEETEKKAASLGISGYTLYRVIAVTYWLCELYFLPVFLPGHGAALAPAFSAASHFRPDRLPLENGRPLAPLQGKGGP